MKRVVRQLRHGQITIPKDLRKAAGIEPDDLLSVDVVGGKVQIEPVRVSPKEEGSPWLRDLYDHFTPYREWLGENYTEEEINEMIDDAVREVRSRKR